MKNKALILKKTYDYIVIGGGLAGLSSAYWLKKKNPKSSVLILNDKKILKSTVGSKISDLTVGSFSYLYEVFRTQGIEQVANIFKEYEENLNLIDQELAVLDRNPYLKIYSGGTFNHFNSLSKKEQGFFESFIYELEKSDVKLKKFNDEKLKLGVKFAHEGYYETNKFLKTIYEKLVSSVDMIEDETCKMLSKQLSSIIIRTVNGNEYKAKNVIFASGKAMGKFIPEVKEKIKVKRGYVVKVESDRNHLELYNYSNNADRDFFVKLKDGYFYAHYEDVNKQDSFLSKDEVINKFNEFKAKAFPSGHMTEVDETEITFSLDGAPLKGRSLKNHSLYYIGGFSGQSKLSAFKAAKELVDLIEA